MLGEVGHYWTELFYYQAHIIIFVKLQNTYFKIALYELKNQTCTASHLNNMAQYVFQHH
jgi:hypothetical protein